MSAYKFTTVSQTPFTLYTLTNSVGQSIQYDGTQNYLVEANGTRVLIEAPGSVTLQYASIAAGPPVFGNSTMVYALNGRGEVGGFFTDAAGKQHGFTYQNGQYQQIDVPGATGGTWVQGIDDFSNLAGVFIDATGQHTFEARPNGHADPFHRALSEAGLSFGDFTQPVAFGQPMPIDTHGFGSAHANMVDLNQPFPMAFIKAGALG